MMSEFLQGGNSNPVPEWREHPAPDEGNNFQSGYKKADM